MANLLDKILVIDVESTCWEENPPSGELSEIIEVGLCLVDCASLELSDKRSVLVQPLKSSISEFCTELTGLRPEMFRDAVLFPEALHILRKEYISKDRMWASWGDYDRRQFERVCRAYQMSYPFGRTHLNVKTIFSIVTGERHELGLDEAYDKLGMQMQGRHHSGADDAWNTARLLSMLLSWSRSAIPPMPA